MKRAIYPMTIQAGEIALRCDRCGAATKTPRQKMLGQVGPYTSLDVALAILSGGCDGQGAPCGLRFVGLAGPGSVRSVLNKRGTGFARHLDVTTPPETWDVLYDGWGIGRVSSIEYGPRRGQWEWSTLTHRPRSGVEHDRDAALFAIKDAMVLNTENMPNTDVVHLYLRSTRSTVMLGLKATITEA